MDKRGISPLIATVLIVGFTVALAAIIISWGGNFIEQMTKRTSETTDVTLKCVTELKFDITKVLCNEESNTIKEVTIENNGNLKIVEIILRVFPKDGDVESEIVDLRTTELGAIGSFGVRKLKADAELKKINTVIEPEKVDAIVRIQGKEGDEPILCTQNKQEYNLIGVPGCQAREESS